MPREHVGMREQAAKRLVETCLEIQREIDARVREGTPADRALAAVFRANRRLGARDRRFIAAAVFAEFRWRGWVRAIEDSRVKLAAALALDGMREFACRFAPEAASAADAPSDLREKAAWLDQTFPGAAPARLEALVPEWTFEEIPGDGAPDFVARFLESIQRRPPLWLRARRGMASAVCERLREAGYACMEDPRVPGALRVEGAPSADALRAILHKQAEIQDISSQRVVHFCAPHAGERWWDMCAGGGGKSLHLLELLGGNGHVYCTDIRPLALRELKRRALAAGYSGWSASLVGQTDRLPADPDGILIDAPCSGIGTWNRNPDARWRITRRDLERHRHRQIGLIRQAFEQLRPGGRLVYAVCSLTKSETVDVIASILETIPARVIDTMRIDPFYGPCIGMWASMLTR
jgi:16S rRNA (cytosine967-C5)-methyltransferase